MGSSAGFHSLAGRLIAEWNRADLSQFVSAGAPDFNVGGGDPALSVVNVSERGNVIRYVGDDGGGGGSNVTQVFTLSTASGFLIPSLTERRDIDFEIEIYDATFGAGGYGPGVFFLGDADTPLHGLGHTGAGVGEWQTIINNGTVEHSAATGSVGNRFVQHRIRGRKPSGAAPEVSSWSHFFTTGGGSEEPRRSGSSSVARGSVNEFGNASSLGATWNNLKCNRLGLLFMSSGGNPAPTQIDILGIRLYVV